MLRKSAHELAIENRAWELVRSAARRQGVDLAEYASECDVAAIVQAVAFDLERDQVLAIVVVGLNDS
jgi:hypothetical protein